MDLQKNVGINKQTSKQFKNKSNSVFSQPKLSSFQSTDKQKVIELLLQNDNVLIFLYEKLFPVTSFLSTQVGEGKGSSSVLEKKYQRAASKMSLLTQTGLE